MLHSCRMHVDAHVCTGELPSRRYARRIVGMHGEICPFIDRYLPLLCISQLLQVWMHNCTRTRIGDFPLRSFICCFFILVQYGRFLSYAMLKQIWWNMLALDRSRYYIAVGFRLTRLVSNRYIYNVSRGGGNSSVPMSIHVSTLHFVYLIFKLFISQQSELCVSHFLRRTKWKENYFQFISIRNVGIPE